MEVDVTHVEVLGLYRLHLRFDDGTSGEVDIAELVPFDGVFEPLHDPNLFRQVRVEPELGTIVWPNGADLDPFVLHEWAAGRRIQPDEEITGLDSAAPLTGAVPPHSLRTDPALPGTAGAREICRFLGLVISMPYGEHPAPRIHVQYGSLEATFVLGPARLLEGKLPPRAIGLVMEWATLHEQELLEDSELSRRGSPLKRIMPLE